MWEPHVYINREVGKLLIILTDAEKAANQSQHHWWFKDTGGNSLARWQEFNSTYRRHPALGKLQERLQEAVEPRLPATASATAKEGWQTHKTEAEMKDTNIEPEEAALWLLADTWKIPLGQLKQTQWRFISTISSLASWPDTR